MTKNDTIARTTPGTNRRSWKALRIGAGFLAAVLASSLIAPSAFAATPEESNQVYLVAGVSMLDGKWWANPVPAPVLGLNDVQLRVPTAATRNVPEAEEFSWLGASGEIRWNTSGNGYSSQPDEALFVIDTDPSFGDTTLDPGDPAIKFTLSNVVAPGTFMLYDVPARAEGEPGPEAPGDLFRWGTGQQRDGTPQEIDTTFELPKQQTPTEAAFGASGMYCFDMTAAASLADGTDVSDTSTVRIAVGDQVPADAECGMATGEVPELPTAKIIPDAPSTPVATAENGTVTVSWEAPGDDGGDPITGYTVTLRDPNRETFTAEVDGNTLTAVFEEVPAGNYRASVVATNANGGSEASSWSAGVTVGEPVRVVDDGHIDAIGTQVDTDEATGDLSLALRAHHDDFGWLEWDDFVLYSDDKAQITLPEEFTSDNDWSFLTNEPGTTVWESPIGQEQGLPWVGLSTEHESMREHATGLVGIRIEGVTGADGRDAPGEFALTRSPQVTVNGAALLASTREALPNGFMAQVGQHSHFGWYFTRPGVYCVAIAVDTVLDDGSRHTDRGLLTHVIGSQIDPADVTPCGASTDYPEISMPDSVPAEGDTPYVFDQGFGNLSLNSDTGGLTTTLLQNSSYRNETPESHGLEDVIFRGAQIERNGRQYHDGNYIVGATSYWDSARDEVPILRWNTFGLPQQDFDGDVTWSIAHFAGPGDLSVDLSGQGVIFDTSADITETMLWTQSGLQDTQWEVTAPGRYCVDMSWTVQSKKHGEMTHDQSITIVAVDDGFEHEAGILTQTCADGADATEPGDSDSEPEPDPGDNEEPWDVPNWSETESGTKILNRGHVDVASLVEDGKLDTTIKDTTTEGAEAGRENGWVSWHEPEDVVFQLLPTAERQIPAREAYGFLGEPGQQFWLAPETQDPSILWPGWSTEHIPVGTLEDGVDWRLTGMDGPGEFFIYTTDPESMTGEQLVWFNTADGIDEKDVLPIGARNHVHGNWAFTAEGVYCIAFERTANLADGTAVSDPFTLAIAVGKVDPTVVDPANCEASEPVATVPDAPAKPDASAAGDAVTVSWTAPVNGGSAITGYTVQLLGGERPLVKEALADATKIEFEGVPAGTYTATVVAVNEIGTSPASIASDAVTVTDTTVPDATAPNAPAAPTATVDGTAVTIEWAAPEDGGAPITGYRVELTGGDVPVVREVVAEATSVGFGNLSPGTYTATLVAINQVGESEKSASSNRVRVASVPDPRPEATAPETPATPIATVDGSTVTVSWMAPADGGSPITGYTVALTGTTGAPIVQELGAETTTATFARAPAGTYTATVMAVNAKGTSQASPTSNEVTVQRSGSSGPGEEPDDQVSPVPDSELTDVTRGGVEVPEAASRGSLITVRVGATYAGEQVRVWLHSNPVLLGTVTLDAGGNTRVTIPADAALGDHKIAVQDLNGSLIGWDNLKIGIASQVGPNGEWLATTGVDGDLVFPLTAGAVILLLMGAVALVGTAKRRREVVAGSIRR
ncbi:choice-of-anchor M domain-containing protein [Microbacterium sp. JB110]|uniref:choice-of-anchor M domain-containing protein n=1 Tax=Microbacterium sp. JB110 TaxID=2024477 RepID=UPI000B359D6E|nr:choice-of-anchor M domain-containing protein [Microbacterium sp. JB110]RCS61291.1 hypothetical protein CIK77_07150 [Microbacterium sp. JB110]